MQDHLGGFRRHVARRHVNARAALNRLLIEVVLCERQGIYAGGFCATPGFAKNHYVVRIPAKRVDVFVYALEGCRKDRKSTRLNSSHTVISYAVFCLKKKT